MKVKKTDLPVIPPESEILPSLDDSDDNFSDDLDDDADSEETDQDEMMADEPLETLDEEDEADDYDSEEDTPVVDQDFMNDGKDTDVHLSITFNWMFDFVDIVTSTAAPTTTSSTAAPSADYVPSQVSTQSPDKQSEIPISPLSNDAPGTSIPTPDPYFTHFDPRMEHQSYKVGLDVKILLNNSHS